MTQYRAIVSITFDDDDIEELAETLGVPADRLRRDPTDLVSAEMDDLSLGAAWVEQVFVDGRPVIQRLSSGISIEINPHEDTP